MTTATDPTVVDLRGLTITTAIVAAMREGLEPIAVGEELDALVEPAPGIKPDLEAWSRATGNSVTFTDDAGTGTHVRVRKGTAKPNEHSVAIVVSNDGLLELLSPLGFALGAAHEGAQVSLYLQGPAVHVLRPGFSPTLPWPMRPFSVFARPKIEASGHVAAIEKLRQLQQLGGRIYACAPSMAQFGVDPSDLRLDDVTVCEYLTFMEVMQEADVQLYP
jgi:predicted peroxiredoxin